MRSSTKQITRVSRVVICARHTLTQQLLVITFNKLKYYSNPCARRIAVDSSNEFISEYPCGCMFIVALPELTVRITLEYPLNSASGANTLIV